jgi:DNA replication and repair protein RecF
VQVRRLWLTDYRSYADADVRFAPGLTAVLGPNGQGKTNLLEAVAHLSLLSSFRGAPADALVRDGAERAIVRAEAERDGRELLVEAELKASGRDRVLLNRQPLRRARDLAGTVLVSVFSPDDLSLVKEGPSGRRRYLDDLLVALDPGMDRTRLEVERVLRQRNALLRQSGGRLTEDVGSTLEVWDDKLVAAGEALGRQRADVVSRLAPEVAQAYRDLAAGPSAGPGEAVITYDPPWLVTGLRAALADVQRDELRRGVSLVGPHRDELDLHLDGLLARTYASQGEQRTFALALRLGAHRLLAASAGTPPVLLLDDVFSELDPDRSAALLAHLPPGQAIITSAVGLPPGAEPELVYEVRDGQVLAVGVDLPTEGPVGEGAA